MYEECRPKCYRIADAIRAEPVTTLHDLAAKVIALSGEGCWWPLDETTIECATILGRAFNKLPRCAGT